MSNLIKIKFCYIKFGLPLLPAQVYQSLLLCSHLKSTDFLLWFVSSSIKWLPDNARVWTFLIDFLSTINYNSFCWRLKLIMCFNPLLIPCILATKDRKESSIINMLCVLKKKQQFSSHVASLYLSINKDHTSNP